MNNENFLFLAESLKSMGFGENLKSDLEENMHAGQSNFELKFWTIWDKKPFEAILQFRKSDTSGFYFFNGFHAFMERRDGKKMKQTFYFNKGKGVTARQAFNLLDGRAVYKELINKEGQPYRSWIQLNPHHKDNNDNFLVIQYHERYGFNLQEVVSKFNIVGFAVSDNSMDLLQSLQEGNLQEVAIEKKGEIHKLFMQADPKFKTVRLFDAQLRPVFREIYYAVGTLDKADS
ncbi:MAG: hypothetical protein ACXVBR_03580 [Flavisolibacter sp.]